MRSGRRLVSTVERVVSAAKKDERTSFRPGLMFFDAADKDDVVSPVVLRIRFAFESG